MSNIVYTTALNKEILLAYKHYQSCKEKFPINDPKVNAAFITFADACEKVNKSPLIVIESLLNETV